METIQDISIDKIIKESLNKSLSYVEYKNLVIDMVAQNTTTGNEKTEALAEYTKLNSSRMRRWDKTLKISDEAKNRIQQFNKKITWLVITESWCGDAAHVIPVINKVAELNENIDLRLVLRDENEDLMNGFLTNGGKAIPKLIAIEKDTGSIMYSFGPRPSIATKLVHDFREEHVNLTPEFKQDLQVWYNKDKGQNIIEDILELLTT